MKKNILFIQGAGEDGYQADAKLVTSLQSALGTAYQIHYPLIKGDETLPDFGWPRQIGRQMDSINGEIILVAHSLGASMLLKYLSEFQINKQISSIFLISTPFWSGEEDWVQGLKLQSDFEDKLPKDVPITFFHCKDDEVILFDHSLRYKQKLPRSTFCEITEGGHQLGNDLTPVAKEIKKITDNH